MTTRSARALLTELVARGAHDPVALDLGASLERLLSAGDTGRARKAMADAVALLGDGAGLLPTPMETPTDAADRQ